MNLHEKLFLAIMGSACALGVGFALWFVFGVLL